MFWGKCQKCKPYLCTMKSFFQPTVSSVSRVQFTIERVYKRSRKTKLGDFSEIIHQKLPLFDKIPLLKLRKTRLSLKFLEQKEFVCKTWNRTQSFVFRFCSPKAFKWLSTPEKHLQWKLVLNFIVAKSLKKFFLKFPLCIANLEGLVQTSLLLFWSVSECRVPLFNQLIQLLA